MTSFLSPQRRMSRVLIAVLLGSFTVAGISQSPASAVNVTASFYISAPGVEGPSTLPGLKLETFNNITPGTKTTGTQLEIGTISADALTVHNCEVGPTCWAGAATSNATPIPTVFNLPASTPNGNYPYNDKTRFAYPISKATIQLDEPVNYFGFYWAAGSGSNTVKLYSGTSLVASFSTADLNTLIPTSRAGSAAKVTAIGGAQYNVNDYRGGHKSAWDSWYKFSTTVDCTLDNSSKWSVNCWNPQQFAYVHAVVPQGYNFDKIEMVASDFEFDNLAIANYTGTFDTTGLVSVPLSNQSSVESLTLPGPSYTVTFDANDDSGVTARQTSSNSTSLRVNTFSRSGYTFAGWSTSPTGTTTDYNDQATYPFTASTTLYARWVPVVVATTTTTTTPSQTTTTLAATTTAPSQTTATSIATTTTVAQTRIASVDTKKQIPVTGDGSRHLLMLAMGMLAAGAVIIRRRVIVS